jgi:hypothetical protein
VSASVGSSGEIDLVTDFAELNINTDGSIDLKPGDALGTNTYQFTKTHLQFPDLSQQDTAFLGMSNYDTDDLNEGSSNLYFSILAHFRGLQIDEGEIKDQGTFYIEPSIGFAYGNQELMESVFRDGKSKLLFSTELRFGFISDFNRIRDWGILARYTWEDVVGPNFRIGLNIKPNY